MNRIDQVVEKTYGNYPEKVLQFGEGNFLRAFADWMIDMCNRQGLFNGSIVLCQPISHGMAQVLNNQNCLYTVAMRGMEDAEAKQNIECISSVSRCINPYEDYEALLDIARSPDLKVIISNTTEAGITYKDGCKLTDRPPESYPAKLCAFLYERYRAFSGAGDKGVLVLPVELIDDNGHVLERIVKRYAAQWNLEKGFIEWLDTSCHITSTLVDRIVTGFPRDEVEYFEKELGYTDDALVTCELFNLWVIEGDEKWADVLPIHKTPAHVIWTDDVAPYKKRKVRILNGAHTSTVLAAFLAGHDTVGQFMEDDVFKGFMNGLLFDEVIPTLDLPKRDLEDFALAVNDRFSNPYIKHKLLDIALNSCSKFNARCLPSLLSYADKKGELPKRLVLSLAAFIRFYKGEFIDGVYTGTRPGGTYSIRDDRDTLEFFADVWKNGTAQSVTNAVLSNESFWSGRDLTNVSGLESAVADLLSDMLKRPMREIVKEHSK
ncbi:MAG: tagaturonate reductase [Clostridia bacterium]|nr:tagaturonate reductase [Clostridia bacterium]